MKRNINDLEDLEPGYEQESMFVQLNKIIDNETCRSIVKAEKFNPGTMVTTEDNVEVNVSAETAAGIIQLLSEMDVRDRIKMLEFIQFYKGLNTLLKCSSTLH
jgi:hypothetical protein